MCFVLGKGIKVKEEEKGQRKLAALEMFHCFLEKLCTVIKGTDIADF